MAKKPSDMETGLIGMRKEMGARMQRTAAIRPVRVSCFRPNLELGGGVVAVVGLFMGFVLSLRLLSTLNKLWFTN